MQDFSRGELKQLLYGCLKSVGFSPKEAGTMSETLRNQRDIMELIGFLANNRAAEKDDVRNAYQKFIGKNEVIKSRVEKRKERLSDAELVKKGQIIRSIEIDWDKLEDHNYVQEIGALVSTDYLEFEQAVTFFCGENGSGKSTLLEAIAIACGFNPEGGSRNYSFSTADTHSSLHRALHITKGARSAVWGYYLRAESFYNVATMAEKYNEEDGKQFARYGGKSFHVQSHGESFLNIMENDIKEGGLYFFDEPEAALSPARQMTLLSLLYKYAEKGAQFIIVTHSPILLATPGADIYEFSERGISKVAYEETESYRIVEMFVKQRDVMLEELIKNAD